MNETLTIEYHSVSELTPYEHNAREHQKEDVSAIKESIQQFGFNDPIGIWGDNNLIVEGHGRLIACQELGIEEVPCIRLDHLTDEERRAYALAHNKTAELSSWNFKELDLELAGISEFDMSKFGFKSLDWFKDRKRFENGEDDNEEYQAFIDKFKVEKTTDDCYTPNEIYEVVADWVVKEYGGGVTSSSDHSTRTEIIKRRSMRRIVSSLITLRFLYSAKLSIFMQKRESSSFCSPRP